VVQQLQVELLLPMKKGQMVLCMQLQEKFLLEYKQAQLLKRVSKIYKV
jgi:hypothetical protein